MASQHLSQPITLPCGAVLPNRIAKAALSESLSNAWTNAPNQKHIDLYRHWSEKTKAGMLLTGNIQIDRRFLETPMNVVVEDERDIDILRKWAAAMSHGTQLWAQISHPGRQCPQSVTSQPLGPSDNPSPVGMPTIKPSRAMTKEEIKDVVKRFVTTSTVLKKAGFHGIQLHAAHGYLLSQFLSANTNRRTDEYGGSLQNRMRLLLEVYNAVRVAVGPSFPIGIKLNSGDFTKGGLSEDESIEIVKALEARGVDLLEVSGGTYENAKMTEKVQRDTTKQREAFFLSFARRAKNETTKMPIMLTGGIRSRQVMENILATNQADVIGLGRPFATDLSAIQGLFDSSTDYLPVKEIITGVKVLDLGLEAAWHAQQFKRICLGLEPDMNMSILNGLKVLPLIYVYHPKKAGWRTVFGFLLFTAASLYVQNVFK